MQLSKIKISIDFADDREHWRTLVDKVMNIQVPKNILGN
jgi:hypothetical protein